MNLDKKYHFPFPPPVVYGAWISPKALIPPATRQQIRAEVGGEYVLDAAAPGFSATMRGEFREVVPNEKLRYSWEWNNDGERSEVTVHFAKAKDGGTDVALKHNGFSKKESVAAHSQGWDSYAAGLKDYLGRGGA